MCHAYGIIYVTFIVKALVGSALIDMPCLLDEDFQEVNIQAGIIEEINMTLILSD